MKLSKASSTILTIAAVVVMFGVGTWALAQNAVPANEFRGAMTSRIGQTERGQAPLPLPAEPKTVAGQTQTPIP